MSVTRVLRVFFRCARSFATLALGYAAFTVARFETGQTILSNEPGHGAPTQLGPRVVVFVHFDRKGEIRDHTRAYIDALRAEGLDIVFVTNSAHLAPPDYAWVHAKVARIIIRRNLGYDFAAWRDAMAACDVPGENTRLLLLANDSVYGPLRQIGPMLKRINFDEADVWSVTDSWQHQFHLQSFFVAFGPQAFGQEAFQLFWRSIRNVRSKRWVVTRYEIGLSRSMMAAGMRCKAIWPYLAIVEVLRDAVAQDEAHDAAASNLTGPCDAPVQRNDSSCQAEPFASADRRNTKRLLRIASDRIPLNPMADLWRVLIEQGCPFLKRELLRENPTRVPDVAAWSSVVGRIDGFDRDIILRDLEKSLKNRTP